MKSIQIVFIIIIFAGITSCKKEKYYLFNDVARLQFGADPTVLGNNSLTDTVKPYTFYYETPAKVQDTAWFNIYAIGGISGSDRPFTLQQVTLDGVPNAEAGKHYKAFNDPSLASLYVIKANQVMTRVPVIVLRDASLKTTTVTLKLEVKENEIFRIGEKARIWRKLLITDRLVRPTGWDNSATMYYFGKYSVVKHQFMIEVTGKKWDQPFFVEMYTDYSLVNYYKSIVTTALIDYNNAHPGNPLRDEDGELLEMP